MADKHPNLGQKTEQGHNDPGKQVVIHNHIHLDLAALVNQLVEIVDLLKGLKSSMAGKQDLDAAFQALDTKIGGRIANETAEVKAAIAAAAGDAAGTIDQLNQKIAALEQSLADANVAADVTQQVADITALGEKLDQEIDAIIPTVTPPDSGGGGGGGTPPEATSRRR